MEGNKVVGPPYETWFYISDRDLLRIGCDLLRMVLRMVLFILMRYTLWDPYYPNLQFH